MTQYGLNRVQLLNEGLRLVNFSSAGPSLPFPDGSSKGSLRGENKAIQVEVFTTAGKYLVEVVELELEPNKTDPNGGDKTFTNGKDAIKFGEKLLKEWNDPMYSCRKMCKKYGMDYIDG